MELREGLSHANDPSLIDDQLDELQARIQMGKALFLIFGTLIATLAYQWITNLEGRMG